MRITVPYGNDHISADLDWADVLGTLTAGNAPPVKDPDEALLQGVISPIGGPPLDQLVAKRAKVLIIVSDSFRRTEIHRLLPGLLAWLQGRGIGDDNISFLFATGSHRAPTPAEQAEILGPAVYARFRDRAHSHDPHDDTNLVYRGKTHRGTPVYINRRACEADLVIATGTVVMHYFGGFGGGRKSIVPGIAGMQTIAANHALNLDPHRDTLNPAVAIGHLDGNPVAEDMLEAAGLCPVHFVINTVRNRDGDIAGLFCGELDAAHRAACALAQRLYSVNITEPADFVVASAGNAKNFVQSHKSLYNAFQVVRPGGPIILAAPAPEGYGGNRFREWLSLGSAPAIIAELRRRAEINGQTALSTLDKSRNALFITAMSREDTEALGGQWSPSLEHALETVRMRFSAGRHTRPTCYVMPDAPCSVPARAARIDAPKAPRNTSSQPP